MKKTKNVLSYMFGKNAIETLKNHLDELYQDTNDYSVFFIDKFFEESKKFEYLLSKGDLILYVDTTNEPTTDGVDHFRNFIRDNRDSKPKSIIGIGGGSTLDTAKAVSNLLNNPGNSEDYQGWDLLKNPGVYKIGIPTLSGTGAEASRTCVMMNPSKNLKLGMNSEFTIYDHLILD